MLRLVWRGFGVLRRFWERESEWGFSEGFWDFGLVVWWCDNEFGVVGDVGYYRVYVNREVANL